MKKNLTNILLTILFFVGLSLLLYPSVSDYWNSFTSSKAIAVYSEQLANMNEEEYERLWQEAVEYNETLKQRENGFLISDEQKEQYENLLNFGGNGVMGYIEIPEIGVSLPIRHGTSESVLQVAAGHLNWTYLPVGGESTHSVLSGHRGLPSARLFTDLDKLDVGDTFAMQILNETLTYEVDRILIVEPNDSSTLLAEPGKDYCTLVTCTPYGINTHRLLVRGHRIENAETAKTIRITSDAIQLEPLIIALFLGVPLLIITMIVMMFADSYANSKMKHKKTIDDIKTYFNSHKEWR